MINNYDSVVACPYTATTHSQKQESTSYTATKRNWLSFVTVLVTLFCFTQSNAQVATNSGSGLAPTYATLAQAITALNAATITDPVVITLSGNETAPVGGYSITATGTATNTITIQGSTSVITAPAQTSGSLVDAVFKISGGDWITIQNFTMNERAFTPVAADTTAGTNTMTEFGVALFYATTTNGAQNCTIQNNTISLNRTYQNTFGIYSNSTHLNTITSTTATATTTAGGNSGLKVYGNAISNVNLGIVVVGPTAAADANTGIDIGGSSLATGNIISNFGTTGTFSGYINVSGTVNGILVRNSNGTNISYNTITSSNGGVTAGTLNGIQVAASSNTPTATFTNTITYNTISLQSGAATGGINGITYPSGSASATSIANVTNNDFTRLNHSVASSGTIVALSKASGDFTTNITNNTFTNLTCNTTGSFTFISHSMTMAAGGTSNVNNNSIVTAFNKTGAGGTVTCLTTGASSPNGTFTNCLNNNFSNITVTGATAITGFSNSDGASSSANKIYTGNILNNWTGGTSAITGITLSYLGGTTSSISNNTITNITGQGAITAINLGSTVNLATVFNVSNNTINNLSSTGTGGQVIGIASANTSTVININNNAINTFSTSGATSAVGGILITGATTTNVFSNTIYGMVASGITSPLALGVSVQGGTTVNTYGNKIYNISATAAISTTSPAVVGLNITGGSTVNSYNNLIGDLKAPAANLSDAIRGISIPSATSTARNIYNNSIYLNASSTGTNFGTSGIYHIGALTATTSALNLQNNIIVNNSTAAGTGLTVAFRKDQPVYTNNVAASNKNLFHAGTPSASNLILFDGSNSSQTMSAFQTAVTPREANSFTETSFNPATFFVSTTGTDANYLKPAAGITTQAEGGGNTIAMTSPDYNGVTRPGGTGTSFDLGAWEFEGISPAPVLTTLVAAPALTAQCTKADRAISIDVTTTSGTITSVVLNYSHNGVAQTPVTMTNSTGNTYTGTMIAPTTGNATVTWSISATNSIGLTSVFNGTTYADEPTTGVTATATASVNPICSGNSTSLSMSVSRPGSITLGTGTALTGATTQPTAFCNRWPSYRMQTIYTAADLTSSGLSAGNISAMAFNITTLGDGATNANFTVRIGTTSQSTFATTAWLTPTYTTVFPAATYTHTASGWQTINFSTPYSWDGISNLIIDIQYDGANATNNSITYFTATTGNTVLHSDTSGKAAATGVLSTTRLNVQFTGNAAPSVTAYSWSDGTTTLGTTNPLVVSTTAATTYTGTATVAGCPMTASTLVNVNPLPTAPTVAANLGQCGAGVPAITMADPNSFTTPIFKWYDAATAGTLLQATASTTYTTAITATTTFYVSVVNPTTGCESARTAVTASVSTADTIAISGAPTASVCLGQSFALTPTQTGTNNTYALTWAASTAGSGLETIASGTLGTALTITPTAAGTYTYSLNGSEASSGCTGAATTASITVVNPNAGITATASATPNPVCSGIPTTLSVSFSNAAPAVYTAPPAVTNPTTDEDLGNITITQGATTILNNTSTRNSLTGTIGVASGTTGSFSNYTAFGPYAMTAGQNYSFSLSSLQAATAYVNSMAIYIDYNRDGDFADANEAVYLPTTTTGTGGHVVTGTFTIPFTAFNGLTRMRVICNEGVITGPTMTVAYGEFEDYMLNISSTTIGGGVVSAPTAYAWSDGSTTLGTSNTLVANPTAATTYTVNATVNGCPLTASTLVNVNPLPTAPTVTASTQCGLAVPTASVADTNSFTTPTFKWYDAATAGTVLQSSPSTTYTTAISTTTTFYVSVINPTTGCESARTPVTVTVSQPDTIGATANDNSICLGESVTLTAANTASTPTQTYAYSWLSTTPNSGITTAQTGASISVTPDTVGSYIYTVTASGGACQTTATVTVTVNALPNINSATASTAVACAGSTFNLAATANDIVAGNATLGSGATDSSSTAQSFFPGFWGGTKTQYIIRASELTAAGISAGPITSLGFEPTDSGQTYQGFYVSLGSTSATTAPTTTFIPNTGLTLVYKGTETNDGYTPVANTVNNLTFGTGAGTASNFDWDGSSNIVVSISWSRVPGATTATSTTMKVDNVGFVSSAYRQRDSVTPTAMADETSVLGTSSSRPKFIFGGQIDTNTTANYAWTWSNGATTVLTSATGSVTLPASTTTYTATATNTTTGCASSSLPITVTANPVPTAPTATNSVQCGTIVPTASVSNTNTFASAAIYNWYATATSTTPLQSSTSATFTSLVNTTTTFHVAVANPTTGCESTRTPVTVTVNVPDLLSASANDTTICIGQSVTISTANLASTPSQNYTYSWASTTGSGLTAGQTAASFTVTPTTEGSYTYTVTGVDGTCQTTASVTVIVSPLPVVTLDVPSTVLACAGSTINLGASVVDYLPGTATLGAGATTGTTYDAIFYHLYGGNKVQYLVTAAELTALGITAGDITALGIDMAAVTPQAYAGFAVSMASTANTNMSAGINSTATFSPVYSSASYTPTTGVNTFNFSTPYNWDGSSNILIQFCWSNNNGGGTSNYALVDTQSYVSAAYYRADNQTDSAICGATTTTGTTSRRPKFIFNAVVGTNQNANYAWTWSDGTTNVLTAASGTVTLPAGTTTYTATATHLVSGCSNVANSAQVVATAVSTTAPAGVNTIAPSSICFGGSVSLSLDYTGSTQGLVFQWQSSIDNGGSWQDIATATASTFTTTQSVETQYRCKLISCGGTPGYSSVATVGFTNSISSTTPATRCGSGTATINAVANTGATISWYANASGGNPVGSGSPFTTPVLNATTTYYVSAETITNANVALGSTAPISTSFTTGSSNGGMVFTTTTNNVVINSIDVLFSGTGDLTINLQNSTGTDLASTTVTGISGSASALTNIILPSTFVVPTAGTGYRIICTSRSAGITWYYQTGAYPFTIPGVSITGGYGWSSTTTYATDLRFVHRMNLTVPTVCASPRVPVTVTVNPAPALTLSSSNATICSGSATAAITATAPDYDTFVWSPATGVTGNSTTGWIFSPTATTTYTLTASQSAGICENIATFTVNVNAVPSAITFTPASPSVCVDNVLTLTAAGGVFSNSLLSQTMDFLPANFISSANATIANNTTYFAQGTGSVRFTAPSNANDWLALNQNVNLVGASSATLTFSHIAATEDGYDFGYVEYSTDGGSTWTTFAPANYAGTASTYAASSSFASDSYTDWASTFTGATSTPGAGPATSLWKTETFNIPAAALTSSQFRIRFRYTSDGSVNYYGWLIDDVKIQRSQSNITWSPVTNLYTNAAATTPYTAGTNATTVYVKSASAATTVYTATSTNTVTTCATTANVSVVVNPLPTVVTVNQTVCSPSTVDLTAAAVTNGSATGLTFTYFTNAAATTALTSPNAVATSGTYYIKGTNANGCSVVTPVTVTVNPLPVLTITNPATVCSPNTVDITAAAVTAGSEPGTLSYWSDSAATTALTTASAVTTSGTYYIKVVNANGCEKIMPVTVTINVTSAPTGAATQTFCGSANITQLVATGSGVKWYDAATGGNLLPNITAIGLTNGTTYYASQTVNGCESTTRFAVTAVINAIPTAPNASAQDFCSAPTVAQLLPNGSTINWYSASTGGTPLASTAVLSATTYYVSQTINGCESTRTAVAITITPIAAPTGATSQTIFGGVAADATIEDISVSGTNVIWYPTAADAAAGTNAIAAGTQLVDGQTYYAVSVVGSCRSAVLAVTTVVVLDNKNFDIKALRYYPNPVIDVLTISYTNEITAVQVYDISGRIVRDMKSNSNEVTVDLSDLAASVYVVKVFADTTSGEFKVVKK